MRVLLIALVALLFSSAAVAQSVQDIINRAGCSTNPVDGLARQLVMQTNRMVSNIFSDLQFSRRVSLAPGARSVPFLQRAAAAGLDCATGRMGFNITVNSALRTLPQQVILYKWYQQRKCGIPLAASPGNSNHESGLAVDVQNANAWQNAMTACGYHRFGPADPVHYDFRGAGAVDIKRTSVKAFQILWNQHNSDKLAEDGLYGPRTESAILRSPARGW